MADGMRIVHHGGMCCGIKTIHCLGNDPNGDIYDELCEPTKKFVPEQEDQYGDIVHPHGDTCDYVDADIDYSVVNSWTNIFDEKAPEEIPRDRLKRYINWIAKRRPSHLVEICLQLTGPGDQKVWVPILEEYGFKMVSEFYNSNSGNKVGVFHLVLLKGKPEGDN